MIPTGAQPAVEPAWASAPGRRCLRDRCVLAVSLERFMSSGRAHGCRNIFLSAPNASVAG